MLIQVKPSKNRPLEYSSLSKGERAGLKEHGLSERQFNALDQRSKAEWKEELEIDAYQNMRKSKLQPRGR